MQERGKQGTQLTSDFLMAVMSFLLCTALKISDFRGPPPSESARRPSSGQMPDTPTRAVCLRLTKTHITPVRSIVEPVPSNLVLSRPERGFTFLSLKSVSPTNALSHDFLRSVVERVAISELCRKVRG